MSIFVYVLRLLAGYFLQVFPYAYICILPFSNKVRVRRPKIITLLFVFSLAVIFAVSGAVIKHSFSDAQQVFTISNIIFMFLLGACIIYYCVIVKATITKKIFVFSFVAIIDFFVSLLSNLLWTYCFMPLLGVVPNVDSLYNPLYVVLLFLLTMIVFPFVSHLTKRYMMPLLELLTETDLKYMSALSAILLALLSLSFAMRGEGSPTAMFLYLSLCITIAGMYIVLFLFIKRIKDTQEIHIQLLKSEHINNMTQEQYKHICENIEAQRQMRHNFRQQLITLRGLCDADENNIRKYLSEYLNQIPEYSVTPLCANAVLNSILSYYKSMAEAENFRFDYHIDIPAQINISDIDLVTILGNLLENAIDAGRLLPNDKRSIVVNIGFSHKMLGITVDNRFNGNILIRDGEYASTKHGHTALGLQSIKNIAEKYNGDAVFKHNGDMFYSSVMLANIPAN